MQPKLQINKLAAQWGCDRATIYRWKKAGAPLTDEAKMREWLAAQRQIPAGTAAKALQAIRQKAELPPIEPLVAMGQGAAQALSRLEAAEQIAHSRFKAASQAGNEVAAVAARKCWTELLEALRKFDAQITEARRVSHDMISKAQLRPQMAFLWHWWAVYATQHLSDWASSHGLPAGKMEGAVSRALLEAVGSARAFHKGIADPPPTFLSDCAVDALKDSGFLKVDDARVRSMTWIHGIFAGLAGWCGDDAARQSRVAKQFEELYAEAGLLMPKLATSTKD